MPTNSFNQPRTPTHPPSIAPLPEGTERVRWSVMIPVYNCYRFLEVALRSVLDQDPGEKWMQIEVVDDGSTDGDVEDLVRRVGGGRVKYQRSEENRGSLRNFERCLNSAQGEWVHLLHGDDSVLPGFYAEIERLFTEYPDAGAAFTHHHLMDPSNRSIPSTSPIPEAGLLQDWLCRMATWKYHVQPPSIVIKRSVYEHLGGFYGVHYGEDWEMWTRIAAHYPVVSSPKPLALYRGGHNTNISYHSMVSGQALRDLHTVIRLIRPLLPAHRQKAIIREARKNIAVSFSQTAFYFSGRTSEKRRVWSLIRGSLGMQLNIKTAYYCLRAFGYLFRLNRAPSAAPNSPKLEEA